MRGFWTVVCARKIFKFRVRRMETSSIRSAALVALNESTVPESVAFLNFEQRLGGPWWL